MKAQVCYASLAIYFKRDIEGKVTKLLETTPTSVGEKDGNFSWIYSTRHNSACETLE